MSSHPQPATPCLTVGTRVRICVSTVVGGRIPQGATGVITATAPSLGLLPGWYALDFDAPWSCWDSLPVSAHELEPLD